MKSVHFWLPFVLLALLTAAIDAAAVRFGRKQTTTTAGPRRLHDDGTIALDEHSLAVAPNRRCPSPKVVDATGRCRTPFGR